MASVAEVFSAQGITQWWKLHISQDFNGESEKGADYNFGYMGAPVGSITAGKVVYVGDGGVPGSAIGQIVQVLTPDGSLVHYQHLKAAKVHTGQTVGTGDIVGLGGGCPDGAYWPDPNNTGCRWTDQYSTGEHIEVRYSPSYNPSGGVWSQNWISPAAIFTSIAAGQAGAATNSPVSSGSASSSASGSPLNFSGWGSKIGIFLLALVLFVFGFYLVFQKQVNSAAKTAVKAAVL